jgi:hypothetical protein
MQTDIPVESLAEPKVAAKKRKAEKDRPGSNGPRPLVQPGLVGGSSTSPSGSVAGPAPKAAGSLPIFAKPSDRQLRLSVLRMPRHLMTQTLARAPKTDRKEIGPCGSVPGSAAASPATSRALGSSVRSAGSGLRTPPKSPSGKGKKGHGKSSKRKLAVRRQVREGRREGTEGRLQVMCLCLGIAVRLDWACRVPSLWSPSVQHLLSLARAFAISFALGRRSCLAGCPIRTHVGRRPLCRTDRGWQHRHWFFVGLSSIRGGLARAHWGVAVG